MKDIRNIFFFPSLHPITDLVCVWSGSMYVQGSQGGSRARLCTGFTKGSFRARLFCVQGFAEMDSIWD